MVDEVHPVPGDVIVLPAFVVEHGTWPSQTWPQAWRCLTPPTPASGPWGRKMWLHGVYDSWSMLPSNVVLVVLACLPGPVATGPAIYVNLQVGWSAADNTWMSAWVKVVAGRPRARLEPHLNQTWFMYDYDDESSGR